MFLGLNPFENQVYFYTTDSTHYMMSEGLAVLIPLRIRSISTRPYLRGIKKNN